MIPDVRVKENYNLCWSLAVSLGVVTGIKVEQQLDSVRVPESFVRVQFVTAAVARQPNPFYGHRASQSTAVVQ